MTHSVALLRKAVTNTTRNSVWCTAGSFVVPTEMIPHDKGKFVEFCKTCKNYNRNGGCPPFAPNFNELRKKYANMLVLWVRMDSDCIPSGFNDAIVSKQMFLVTNYLSLALPAVIRDCYLAVKDILNPDMTLWESECKICKRMCAFRNEDPKMKVCKYPKERRCSMESTGIDVDGLMRLGAFPLYWFESGKPYKDTPYVVKVMGLLYKKEAPNVDVPAEIVKRLVGNTRFTELVYQDIT